MAHVLAVTSKRRFEGLSLWSLLQLGKQLLGLRQDAGHRRRTGRRQSGNVLPRQMERERLASRSSAQTRGRHRPLPRRRLLQLDHRLPRGRLLQQRLQQLPPGRALGRHQMDHVLAVTAKRRFEGLSLWSLLQLSYGLLGIWQDPGHYRRTERRESGRDVLRSLAQQRMAGRSYPESTGREPD